MTTIARTIRQWLATIRHLEQAPTLWDPRLNAKIRKAIGADPYAHPDSLVSIALTPAERHEVERAAPMTAWWMPPTPGEVVLKQEACAAVTAAEAIIREHQGRQPNT